MGAESLRREWSRLHGIPERSEAIATNSKCIERDAERSNEA
jgi:hypothetical protein